MTVTASMPLTLLLRWTYGLIFRLHHSVPESGAEKGWQTLFVMLICRHAVKTEDNECLALLYAES